MGLLFLDNSLRHVLKWMPPGKALSATKAEAMPGKGGREKEEDRRALAAACRSLHCGPSVG